MNQDAFTIREELVGVGDGHQLYAQLWGNPKATTPLVFLHGGPGSGCSDSHKGLFNPEQHQVLFIDQRGCGKSLPYGSLEHNTTQGLIADITKLADHFGLEKFAIIGGSWGSLLGLAYAEAVPERVTALIMRGLFTGRKSEIDFLDKGECKPFFPDVWAAYLERTPTEFHDKPGDYHAPRVLGQDEQAMKESAYAYSELEGSLISLDDRHSIEPFEAFDPYGTRIEVHYLVNECFLPEGDTITKAPQIKVPVWLVQGRYDMVCPPYTAYELHRALPNSHLIWTQAGHSGSDRANADAVKAILSQFA